MAGEQLALANHRRVLKGHKDHRLLPQRACWSSGGLCGKGQEIALGGLWASLWDCEHKGDRQTSPGCDLGQMGPCSKHPEGGVA